MSKRTNMKFEPNRRKKHLKQINSTLLSIKNLKSGSKVRLELKDDSIIEGMLLPQTSKDETSKTIFIKLDNGYNVGILLNNIKSFNLGKEHPRNTERADKKTSIINQMKKKVNQKASKMNKVEKTDDKNTLKKYKPLISILHTGGTIASKVDYKTGAVIASFRPDDLLRMFPELKEIADFRSRLIGNFLSENLRPEHYNLIAKEVLKEVKAGADGIIITHGTDTMHYTSAALSFILEGLKKPVLLVGAQRSSDRASSDAYLNLINAVFFIAKSDFAGVAISMHESMNDTYSVILPGCKVRKLHTSRRDAFKPVNAKPIARVDYKHKKVDFFVAHYTKKEKGNRQLKLRLVNPKIKVAMLSSFPGLRAEQVLFFKKYDGLVLEGTGLGHFPILKTDKFTSENERIFKALKNLSKKTILVMSSQTIFGRVNMNVYSPGRKLLDIGVLGNYSDMTPETAYIKLWWLLSNYSKKEIIKNNLIMKNFRGEISLRTSEDFQVYEE